VQSTVDSDETSRQCSFVPLSNLKGQYFQAAGTDPYVSVLYAWLAGMPDPSREGAKDQTSRGPSTTRSTLLYSRTACLSSGSGCVQQQLLGDGPGF